MKLRLFALLLCLIAPLARAADAGKPNVVIILVDDMGIMDTSVPFLTGPDGKPQRYPLNDYYRTPAMERLAARGIRFNQFCAMSVCSPTRISIMTGQNAVRHRTTNWINPDNNNSGPQGPANWNWRGLGKDDVTLPRMLREAGYRTIHVGKGHFGPRDAEGADPTTIGFDVNVAGASIGAPGSYYGQQNFDRKGGGQNPKRGSHAVLGLEKYHGTDTFLTDALTMEAKAHVSSAVEARKPFFLYLAHYAVHAPFDSDPRFAAHYRDSGKPAAAQAFATLVEGMDKSLGQLMDHLEKLGVAEDTLLLFLGDNGSDAPLGHQHDVACAAPLRGKKGSHYEGGVRVPFIASWVKPNADNAWQRKLPIASGAIQTQLAGVYDLLPTLAPLTGIRVPANHKVDGSSLATLFTGQRDPARGEDFLMHYPHAPHRTDYFTTLRSGDWKVIYHYFPTQVSSGSHYQLFQLREDPFEQKDLAKERPEDLRRMMQALAAGLEQHGALYPMDKMTGQAAKPVVP